MIATLARIPAYMSMRYLGWPRLMPANITVAVTYQCNSRCLTCNIWGKKKASELSLGEYDKIFSSVGKSPYWITVSGGEPFLRKDLVDVVDSACALMEPGIVNIPTNGLVAGTAGRVGEICEANPKTNFIVNLSLDGIGAKHDEIRGVPGAFEKAMKTYQELKSLWHGNLEVGIHTVISRYNVTEIPKIYEFMESLKPSSYITEIAEQRVELDTMDSDITPSVNDYEEAVGFLKGKMRQDSAKGIPKLVRTLRGEYYDLVVKTLRQKRQIIPCYAGFYSAQIAPDGNVWACCIRADPLGNLREVDYDFKKIWWGEKARSMRKSIKRGECFCPLANASYTNMLCNPGKILKIGAKLLVK
ncbi:MAG: radical SAM protein [Candidatus Altiarchaeota archaeon]